MQIPIIRDYYDEGYIYPRNFIDIQPGFSVLVGCNGSGKTTLLTQIKDFCKKFKIPVVSFDNLQDGGANARGKMAFYEMYTELAQNMASSEGEQINQNLTMFANKIGRFITEEALPKKLGFILLDAADSGLSIDHVIEFKKDLIETILQDCESKEIEIYIIVSANEYEMASGEKCINVSELKYEVIKNYDKYRKIIIKSRQRKNKRYKWGKWDYE